MKKPAQWRAGWKSPATAGRKKTRRTCVERVVGVAVKPKSKAYLADQTEKSCMLEKIKTSGS